MKRPEYVALAIRNINSLHFYNPTHKVKVYVDAICKKAFLSRKKDIDYPNTVECVEFFSNKNQPWQYMKIEALIEASKQSAYLVDADTRWFADPVVSDKKMTFLVFANYVDDNQMERNLITSVFHKKKWGVYGHYVSGFVSIPQRFMTLNLKQKLRAYVRKIYENTEGETRRLSEELAISYAVQSLYLKRQITTLKASDGPGDRHIMQSMYYGCSNRIIT
ncbi:MAG TPA: hypothetical protein VLH19_04910 [Patescibacteria group bacterium]|nr:hypothetical protein [Patescibacteria group bacterium]